MKHLLSIIFILFTVCAIAQTGKISGKISDAGGTSLEAASIRIPKLKIGVSSDDQGNYVLENIPYGTWEIEINHLSYTIHKETIIINSESLFKDFVLEESSEELEGVVISGTMKPVSKLDSPIPVEVYTSKFFKANPTPSLFDALQNVNGVRPQLNCNVCNTGDIHINGLEGPYTMVLIDGMPIVSGLSTVYGLSGIPQSLIDRVEIVKGPASTLYGSEAVGGLINVITKRPGNAPIISADIFGTTWGEVNADIAAKFNAGKKAQSLLGINYFNYTNPIDNNNDGFTDLTLQNRISIFNKWNFDRKDNRIFTIAGRYLYEDRWGGQMNWNRKNRGGDEVYAESIYTSRWELFGNYQLPIKEKVFFQFSLNGHDQNSAYGDEIYIADQKIAFGQFFWDKTIGRNDLLIGATYRYTFYDDNTPATASFDNPNINEPSKTHLPGVFVQDEITLSENNKLLLGARYDYNSIHGSIITPRINYKWNSANKNNILRVSFGNGYRVANVFTEDHAALTGARQVVFMSELKPEKSWNGNINYVKRMNVGSTFIGLDATAFYTYFTNKIIPDYQTDPNKIIYDNLNGNAVSQGVSLNIDVAFENGLKILAGGTIMDVSSKENGIRERQLKTERFMGTWTIGYTIKEIGLTIDYTGNVTGPMKLPLLSDTDPRRQHSPWWSIQNIQLTKKVGRNIEIYGGVKNLLNWTIGKTNPFVIARSHDPFDRDVTFDANGQAMVTPNNPYGLTFDPDTYSYGPNQGIRGFLGFRYNLF
ncbi:TonB-dependent receptor [Sphingobacterium corticibacterium]|uniref:TonB-dependent receptor n=1 Tax=Sphingobacterium corticibacterium TaxID=2484746 RepID=A0A4V2DBH1_9SPHI|nr:TonB-dependent receptor [Sphingobacterium corticibacterium]RZF57968.1 TonB-dependent receptor [Sphingobacterium corticibacterium]